MHHDAFMHHALHALDNPVCALVVSCRILSSSLLETFRPTRVLEVPCPRRRRVPC